MRCDVWLLARHEMTTMGIVARGEAADFMFVKQTRLKLFKHNTVGQINVGKADGANLIKHGSAAVALLTAESRCREH